jgi:hypothetical protein
MVVRLLIVFLLDSLLTFGQTMNSAGHFIQNRDEVYSRPLPAEHSFQKDKIFINIKNGYIVLPGACESSPSFLKILSENGEEIYSKDFPQVINLKLSPDRSFCAFHDLNKIVKINLTTLEEEKFFGTNVFAINNNGQVSYYDEEGSTVCLNQSCFPVHEPIYKVLFYRQEVLFMARNNIFSLKDGVLKKSYGIGEGRFFDWAISGEDLFFSVKTENPEEFVFQSFQTKDLISFQKLDEKHFKRKGNSARIFNNEISISKFMTSTGELIRNPLNFYSDTVYQPIGNSYAEIQNYNGNPRYLHPGVDLLGNYLQDVHSVKKGFVKAVLTTSADLHWRIAISNENTANPSQGYLYAHLDSATIPFQVGDSVEEGDIVGLLVFFSPDFNHCHFARIQDSGAVWIGNWWTFQNPLSYMTNFFDTIAPVFEKTINNDAFAFRDVNGNYLDPDSLHGQVKVISKFYDIINSTWHVDVNTVRYNLSPLASPQTLLLDSFSYEYDFFTDVYPAGPYNGGVLQTIYSLDSVCLSDGNYQFREFYHIVTNSDGNDTINSNDSLQFFNTLNFQDGSYIIRVFASDPSGNTSMDSMIIRIRNSLAGIEQINDRAVEVFPNPSLDGVFNINYAGNLPLKYEVYNYLGEKISESVSNKISNSKEIFIKDKGIYFLHLDFEGKSIVRRIIRL